MADQLIHAHIELRKHLTKCCGLPEQADLALTLEFALTMLKAQAADLKYYRERSQALIASEELRSAARNIEHHLNHILTHATTLIIAERHGLPNT